MSAVKTVAGFAIVAAVLATGAKAQRAFEVEADNAVAPLIEQTTRMTAADFNPKVGLVVPELKGFSILAVKITRSRVGAMLQSSFGGSDRSYDVYVKFHEGDSDRCLTLEAKWKATTEEWKVTHPGADDRCEPLW